MTSFNNRLKQKDALHICQVPNVGGVQASNRDSIYAGLLK
jgi:hypothetical protein